MRVWLSTDEEAGAASLIAGTDKGEGEGMMGEGMREAVSFL
jgi:hypothetical protein